MSHTNAQVAAAFVRGDTAQSLHMRCQEHARGFVLYSYQTPIAFRQDDGSIRVSSQRHSITTTRHHSELWSAAYAAGYDGPPHWIASGNPRDHRAAIKAGYDPDADTVPFHQDDFPATRFGRAKTGSYHYGEPRNQSDHDARAVLWTFSQDAYEVRAGNREWYESRNHTTVSHKEPATV